VCARWPPMAKLLLLRCSPIFLGPRKNRPMLYRPCDAGKNQQFPVSKKRVLISTSLNLPAEAQGQSGPSTFCLALVPRLIRAPAASLRQHGFSLLLATASGAIAARVDALKPRSWGAGARRCVGTSPAALVQRAAVTHTMGGETHASHGERCEAFLNSSPRFQPEI